MSMYLFRNRITLQADSTAWPTKNSSIADSKPFLAAPIAAAASDSMSPAGTIPSTNLWLIASDRLRAFPRSLARSAL